MRKHKVNHAIHRLVCPYKMNQWHWLCYTESIFNMEYFDFCFFFKIFQIGIRTLRYISTWNTFLSSTHPINQQPRYDRYAEMTHRHQIHIQIFYIIYRLCMYIARPTTVGLRRAVHHTSAGDFIYTSAVLIICDQNLSLLVKRVWAARRKVKRGPG